MAAESFFIIYFLHISLLLAFNLDTDVPIVKEWSRDSYFGFSVAQHQINIFDRDRTTHVILVGAPRDNITRAKDIDGGFDEEIYDVDRPGAVYSCELTSLINDCTLLLLDTEAPLPNEFKNGQWMGVSVSSQGTEDGQAAACAHRNTMGNNNYRIGQGFCIGITNALDASDFYDPCNGKDISNGHGSYGFCQAGTSMDISRDGDILTGLPGPYNWRGTIAKNTLVVSMSASRDWFFSPVETVTPQMPLNTPRPTIDYYSNLGMSTHACHVWRGQKTYLGGAPRSNGVGEVLLYVNDQSIKTPWLTLQRTLRGDQFGSGFGYSVTTLDINNDGLDDLIVGAPFYHGADIGGIIYIYMNDPYTGLATDAERANITSRTMSPAECEQLNCVDARFGFSLTALGDVDKDGFNDLAVGSPFEGNGVVYIFRGSRTGLIPKYSQRITTSDLNLPPQISRMESFGYSLSGGNDMDNNGYPDLVIGSYKSDHITVLRSRPVIHVYANFSSEPHHISNVETQCPHDGHPFSCFKLKVCLKFKAQPYSEFTRPLEMNYRIEAEKFTGRSISRAFFRGVPDDQNHIFENTVRLHDQSVDRLKCKKHTVYITKSTQDFMNPIAFRMTYSLPEVVPPRMTVGQSTLPDLNAYPVLDEQASQLPLNVPFVKNCGPDDICQSNLRVNARFQLDSDPNTGLPLLKIGETQTLRLNIQVSNNAEDAHLSTLTCHLPDGVEFTNVDSEPHMGKYPCIPVENYVLCNIGNPLPQGYSAEFTLRLNPSGVDASHRMLEFGLHANTTSMDIDTDDNVMFMEVKVVVEADMLVRGDSDPREVYYGGWIRGESAMRIEQQIGPNVLHTYEVKNAGLGHIQRSNLTIWWPYEAVSHYPQGKHLLYMMEPPEIDTPGICTTSSDFINPLNLKIDEDVSLATLAKIRPSTDQNAEPRLRRGTTSAQRSGRKYVQSQIVQEGSRSYTAVIMSCHPRDQTAKCFRINCQLGAMQSGDSMVVRIRARLWNSTFVEDYRNVDFVRVLSYAAVTIDPSLNVQQPSTLNDFFQVGTKAIKNIKEDKSRGVPLWVIILAVIGGLILLTLFIIALWKCGFFKRRRPTDMISHRGKVQKKKKRKTPHSYDDDAY